MELQAFLRNTENPVKELIEKYFLDVTYGQTRKNLVSFRYNQISSDFSIPMVREARGCIFDQSDDWRLVARPFDKFFGSDDIRAAQIDWRNCKIQEKIDGSCLFMYWYDGQWRVGTLGSPEASGPVEKNDFTFADLFWRVFREKDMELPPAEYKTYTFIFEMTTKFNRVVIPHKDSNLTLIGCRDILTGEELSPISSFRAFKNWIHVRDFPVGNTLEACIETFKSFSGFEQEGYVVVDKNFNRIKIKHPEYTAAHLAKDQFTPKSFLNVIRANENQEFTGVINMWPEFQEQYNRIKAMFDSLCIEAEFVYEQVKDIPVQKDFALTVMKFPYKGYLFSRRKNQVRTAKEYFGQLHIDNLLALLPIKETESSTNGSNQQATPRDPDFARGTEASRSRTNQTIYLPN